MGSFFGRPPAVVPRFGHPILRNQSLWLLADRNNPPSCILNRGYAAFAQGAVADHRDGGPFGFSFNVNDVNGMDLGSSNRFLSSDTQPCSFLWVETSALTSAFGLANLKPNGSSASFNIGRTVNTVIDSTHGGTLSVGMMTGAATNHPGSLLVPKPSDKTPLVIGIVAAAGVNNTTLSNWTFYWNGGQSGIATPSASTSVSAAASTTNYFGWDTLRGGFTGVLDNFRIWNRALSRTEMLALMQDPYLGAVRTRYTPARYGTIVAPSYLPWTMMQAG